jgi:hypothetical protein
MKNRLKPMGVGAVLDNSFSILRERFWTFQGVNFLALLPTFILLIICVATVLINVSPYIKELGSGFGTPLWTKVFTKLWPSFLIVGILFIPLIIAMIIGSIYVAYGNIKLYRLGLHQEKCTVKQAFEGIKGKRWRYIGTELMVYVFSLPTSIIGTVLIFVGVFNSSMNTNNTITNIGRGISYLSYIVYFLFALSSVVVFLENNTVMKTLSRSFHLMDKHRWRLLGTLVVVYLLGYVLILMLLCFGIIPIFVLIKYLNIVTILLACIFGLASLLIFSICASFFFGPITAIYYDLLIRKEGYDIQQQLAEEISTISNENDRSITV